MAGFTVLETSVALLVLMVVGLGATSLFFYAVRYNAGAAERTMALAVAQQQLEELRALPWDDPLLNATSADGTAICTSAAPCYSANRPYTVTKIVTTSMNVTVNGVTRPTMKTITLRVMPLRGGIPWTNGAISVTAQRATLVRGPN
jgi:Tfp pilus assembly protein PilV